MLEVKDKKLIYALDFDSRMTLSKLGKEVSESKQTIKYRLDRLQNENIIEGFYVDIDPSRIGMNIYLVYFNFHKMSNKIEENFIIHISKQKNVGVNVTINGKWDHCIGIWAESVYEFRKIYSRIMKDYEKFVKDKTIMIETDFYYFKPKQIFDKNENKRIEMRGSDNKIRLDEIDKEILKILSKNARERLVDIGIKLNLTANGVKNRIRKLEENKVILGSRVMINYQKLGYFHHRVFLHLENLDEKNEEKIISWLGSRREIVSVTKTIGYCEIEFRSVTKDFNEFSNLIKDFKSEFSDNIKDVENILYEKFHDCLDYFPVE